MQSKFEVTNILNPFIKVVTEFNNELKNLLEDELYDFLQSQLDKFYKVNTFLHRGEKVRLDDIYFPVSLKHKALITDFEDIESIFDEYKFISIIGFAGSGKSTLMKRLYLNCINKRIRIPIFIELRRLNNFDGDLLEYIHKFILKKNVKPSKRILERALKKGEFLFLFDGYDEIYSSNKEKININIEEFIDIYSKNIFVITSRPESGLEQFNRCLNFNVLPLREDEVPEFISKMTIDKDRKNRMLEVIEKGGSNTYYSYLQNPLLLSMFILSFEHHPEIPERRSSFYRNVFDTLYSRHDGINKSSYPREKLSKLQKFSFEEVIKQFSYLTYFRGVSEFTEEYLFDILEKIRKNSPILEYDTELLIKDLSVTIAFLVKDGLVYNYLHRSMQEYFTALFISQLESKRKIRFYKKNIKNNNFYNDWGIHFWRLLEELDSKFFNQYFILPKLKNFVNEIEKGKSDYEKFIIILKSIKIHIYLNKKEKDILHFGIPLSEIILLIDFLGMFDTFIAINNHKWNKKVSRKIYSQIENSNSILKSTKRLSEVMKIEGVYDIFVKEKLVTKFLEGYKNLINERDNIENKIKNEDRSIDDLLKI